jgi:hypothetical protein
MRVAEIGLSRQQIVSELTRSAHGSLIEYRRVGAVAAAQDPEFMSHLIAWNADKGQMKDSQIALPVVQLAHTGKLVVEFEENALAHLASLSPRDLVRAVRFSREIRRPLNQDGYARSIRRTVQSYLYAREMHWPWWERTVLAHRQSMQELYALCRVKPTREIVGEILFEGKRPKGTIFYDIAQMKDMDAVTVAGTILLRKIPHKVAVGAMGKRTQDEKEQIALALIQTMTPTEIVTNTKMLEDWGVKRVPALRAAYEEAIGKVGESKKATFKTTRAAEMQTDKGLQQKLQAAQSKQIEKLGKVEGNWLVLGDRSPSMKESIEVAKMVAGTLAAMVKGQVHLVFFDNSPTYYDVTGRSYDEIKQETRHVSSHGAGGTSIGVGLGFAMSRGLDLDGIAIVSDAQENCAPYFHERYERYRTQSGKEPPVYLYRVKPAMRGFADIDLKRSMAQAGIELSEFDLQGKTPDYYSLPAIVGTMRVNRYSLVQEIMEWPLMRVIDALQRKGAA